MCTVFGRSLISLSGDEDVTLRQRRDLAWRHPEFGEDFGRVFADRRRLAAQSEIVLADFDRQARQFGGHAIRKFDVEHTAKALSCGSSNRSPGLATGANEISIRSNSSASSASDAVR